MIAMRRPYARSIALIIVALLVVPLGQLLAQGSTVDVPANASAKRYGGWVLARASLVEASLELPGLLGRSCIA